MTAMAQLQVGHHEKLYLLGTIAGTISDERLIHKELYEYRLQGEWFEPKSELLETINDVIENQRSWYYFRQVKYNRLDIECKGLRELVIELRKNIKVLEKDKEAWEATVEEKITNSMKRMVSRIGKMTAKYKALEESISAKKEA